MKLQSLVERTEFSFYLLIGGLATLIDWTLYALAVNTFSFHYQFALLCGYLGGGTFHYIANKLITFKCQSKAFGTQVSLFLLVQMTSLGVSMLVMMALVHLFASQSVIIRMMTTGIMILPNYLLHKHLTFNKKIFV